MPNHEASDGCKMKGAAPYFLVDDVFATAEFYRDFLGFTFNEFFGDPPSFTIVERDGVCILFRQVRPARPPVAKSQALLTRKLAPSRTRQALPPGQAGRCRPKCRPPSPGRSGKSR